MLTKAEPPTPSTFWRESENDHWAMTGEAKDISPGDLIREAETKLGLRLPALLKTLYERKKGGYTDYAYYPRVSMPRAVDDDWLNVNVDGEILPPNRLETLGELADITDFGDEDLNYRNQFDNADRVIVLSRHGWETFLCLDYTIHGPQAEPEVVYLEEGADGLEEILRVTDFETFFSRLRREDNR